MIYFSEIGPPDGRNYTTEQTSVDLDTCITCTNSMARWPNII